MARGWRSVAVLTAIAFVAPAACRRRSLDPAGQGQLGDGGVVLTDGAAPPGDGAAAAPDASQPGTRTDAGPVTADAGSADADAGAILTAPPVSACAVAPERPPAAPAVPASVVGCGGSLPMTGSMWIGPVPDGQRYLRCGTLGPETAWQVTLSPDGGHLAARTSAGTVRLYRTDRWDEIAQLASPVGMIDAVAFSPDGARLATLSGEMGQLNLWNVGDGTRAATFAAPPISTIGGPSSALAFSSDGRRIATSLGTIVDLATGATTTFDGKPAVPYDTPINPAGQMGLLGVSTQSLRFVGCDQRLLIHAATPSGMLGWIDDLSLLDPATGTSTGLAGGRFADLGSIVVSAGGRWVAFVQHGDTRQGIHLYDAAAAKLVAFDPTPPRFIAGFSHAGDRLFIVTDTAVEVREVPTLRRIGKFTLAGSIITAASVSPRDQVILSTAANSAWVDSVAGAAVRHEPFPIADPQFATDGRVGVTAGSGPALFHFWGESNESISCAPAADAPGTAIAGFAASQDAATLAMVDATGAVQVRTVDAATSEVRPPWTGAESGLVPYAGTISISVANGGGYVAVQGGTSSASAALTSRVVVLDTRTGRALLARDVLRAAGPIAISPDGVWVAFQDGDYTTDSRAVALSVNDGTTKVSVTAGSIAAFSPESQQLAVAAGGVMQVWDLPTGVQATTYAISGSSTADMALSPDWSLMGGVVSTIPYAWDHAAALVWHPQDGGIVGPIGNLHDLKLPPHFDTANTIAATVLWGMHTLGVDWDSWYVWSLTDATELRVFATSARYNEPLVMLPGGQRLLTAAGTGVAVWCR